MTREIQLWIAIAAAPALWFLSLEANFAISPAFCRGDSPAIPLLISFAAMAGTAAFTAYRMKSGPLAGLAAGAAYLNAIALTVIAAQTIPTVLLAGCR